MRPEQLTEFQLDALREVGSIGASHAATALSQLLGRPVRIEVPDMRLLRVTEVPGTLGAAEELIAAAYCRILGDLSGSMLIVAPEVTALALTDHLHGREAGETTAFGHDEQALFVHVAFLQAAAYLAAISRMMDISVLPSPPQFALDMAGAILQVAISRLGLRAEKALVVQTRFHLEELTLDASLLFMPDPESLDVVLTRLGLA